MISMEVNEVAHIMRMPLGERGWEWDVVMAVELIEWNKFSQQNGDIILLYSLYVVMANGGGVGMNLFLSNTTRFSVVLSSSPDWMLFIANQAIVM